MKCLILFSGKNKKNVINLSFAEFAQRVVIITIVVHEEHPVKKTADISWKIPLNMDFLCYN